MNKLTFAAAVSTLIVGLASCGADIAADPQYDDPTTQAPQKDVVFVIPMENRDAAQIYGNKDAPYINGTLLQMGAHATDYGDDLPGLPSEPHYIWMEAGTNAFTDWTAKGDKDPSAQNSTDSPEHLATQLVAAGKTWMAYQEGIGRPTGACPVHGSGLYAPKHDPFVFFQDVSGSPPSPMNEDCASHHKPMRALADDLANGDVANYNFITPNLCHDMHGAASCLLSNRVKAGDKWLAAHLPPVISYAQEHNGVVLLVWDEPDDTGRVPFIIVGAGVKAGFTSDAAYSHSSLLKSLEQMLDVPVLPSVADASDFAELFDQ